tara:strand:+ start:993 stop:1124 length:132 start_codon:yes stop_codon:yes gene_type:complete
VYLIEKYEKLRALETSSGDGSSECSSSGSDIEEVKESFAPVFG